jgi:hypothetical protein
MNSKVSLWGIGLASFLALVSFLTILWLVSPENSNATILFLLFSSLFLSLCGFFGLMVLGWRWLKIKGRPLDTFLGISFREGTMLSLLLVGFLIMQVSGIFHWWTALIFLIIILAIEMAFLYQGKE